MNYNYDFYYEYNEEKSGVNDYNGNNVENIYTNAYSESGNSEEDIKRQIVATEEEMYEWDMISRHIKDMESTIVDENNRALERIDNIREISSKGDVVLSQLWEMKASILQNLNRNSYDFNEMFEEEDRRIRARYEEKVSGLYEELRSY